MKIIFMGTPEFAVVCLRKLLDEKMDIAAVVTAPDKPAGRGRQLKSSPVKKAAQQAGLPVWQPQDLKDLQFLQQIDQLAPDLMIIVAFRILPEALYSKAGKGAVNLHGSLLPKYRGAAPINWAIINGESKTGVTTFFLKKKVDTGNIIARREIAITPDMTAGELHDIMALAGADLLLETIRMIEKGSVQRLEQDETQVSQAPKIFPEDCRVNFHKPAGRVHNFIRGLTPHPGAYSYLSGRRVQLAGTQVLAGKQTDKPPGTIAISEDNQALWVSCRPGIIAVRGIKAEGKRQMSIADFLRGHPLPPGTCFGE